MTDVSADASAGASPEDIARAAAILRRGGLVAFPTETVYGLGANALDAEAVARIFAAKGRPAFNPVIVHVADVGAARAYAAEWPPVAERLAARWPGPLTLVVRRTADIPDIVTAGRDSVGLRVPAHPLAQALLAAAGVPIAAPSANRYTRTSPTTAAHVRAGLGDGVDLVLDGGPTDVGIESTVVDVTVSPPVVLRPGSLTLAELSALAGEPVVAAEVAFADDDATPRVAPGQVARHYAPHADVWLFDPADAPLVATRLAEDPRPTAALLVRSELPASRVALLTVHRLPDDAEGYARQLYATLHAADAAGAERIVIERPPAGEAWRGVLDRLTRAAR